MGKPHDNSIGPRGGRKSEVRHQTSGMVTARSSGLLSAAADDEHATPGQQLLAALHASETTRRERYSNTVECKMQGVCVLRPHPKHATASELAMFANVVDEVHRLPSDPPAAQPGLQGVTSMLVSKEQRHQAAWQRYLDSREEAAQQHDQAAAAAASALRADLCSVEADMSVLAEDRVVQLDEQQLLQVWEAVAQRRGAISSRIEQLAAELRAAEAVRRTAVDAALRLMVRAMADVAHLDEGSLQRLLEAEALALNMQLCDNRRVAAELLQQLLEHEVLQEQSRRKRWQEASASWRALRSHHAIKLFSQHVKQDLSEPPACLQLFAELRSSQQVAHARLLQLCRRVSGLQPPQLSVALVQAWVAEVTQWGGQWQQQLEQCLQQLRQQEDEQEQQAQAGINSLRVELLSYKGFSAEQIEQLLQQEVAPVLAARQAAAGQLLLAATTFLSRQAAEWQFAVSVLCQWLTSLAALFSDHKSRTAEVEAGIKAQLRAARKQFEQEDADREAALDAAVLLLSRAGSEAALDACQEAALQHLAGIAAGYRAYTAGTVHAIREHPAAVRQRSKLYAQCLCGMLHLQQRQQQAETEQPLPSTAAGGGQAGGSNSSSAGLALLEVPGGTAAYAVLQDLWQALQDATPKPWLPQRPPTPIAELPDSSAVATAGSKPPATCTGPAGKPLSKQQVAEAAAAAAAAAEAEAAAAAAAEAAAAADPPPCPVTAAGLPLCEQLELPASVVQDALHQLQVSLVLEMEVLADRCQGAADSWAEQVEGLATEELDGRLRSHRVRAGRIEEEVRAARSNELLAQRRRLQSHMQAQSQAVKAQAAQHEEAVQQLRADGSAWKAKLLGCERLLGVGLSLKGLEVMWRELLALRLGLDGELQERVDAQLCWVETSCSSVVAANRRFETEHLKTFEEGGRWAQESAEAAAADVAGIDRHMAAQQQRQQEQLAAVQRELAAELLAAQAAIEGLLPSFKQDMALIEALNRSVEGAKKAAASQLSQDCQATADLNAAISRLQERLAAADGLRDQAAALGGCEQLLGAVDQLRHQLLRRAQVLDMLQSAGLTETSISLSFASQLQPLVLPGAAPAAAEPLPAAGAKASVRPGTGQKAAALGGRPGSSGGAAPAARSGSPTKQAVPAAAAGLPSEAVPAVSLARAIQGVIDAAKQEVEAAAKAYYAAKDPGRPVRFPARIPASLPELMAQAGGVLTGLTQQLQQHVALAAKQLRVQVVQAYRLLERVPEKVLPMLIQQRLLAEVQQQQAALLATFGARRLQLEQQAQQHKSSLRPSMLHPSRHAELEALKAAEEARQAAAVELAAACATACLGLTSSHAAQLTAVLAELCRLLLLLLDGCVMPADLVAAPEGDDALSGLPHRSLAELTHLAAAQDEAAPAGPAASVPAAAAAAAKPAAKAAVKAAADAAADNGSAGGSPRRFPCVFWQLAAGVFGRDSLGWSAEDEAAIVTRAGKEGSATEPAGAAAAKSSSPAPAVPKPPPAGAIAAGSHTPQQPPAAAAPLPAEPGVLTVTGLDTPWHRAVIRAQRAAMLCNEQALAAAVRSLKAALHRWNGQEQQWAEAWRRMIDELDCV